MSTATEGRRSGGRLAVLDGFRLVAALAVAAYHYTQFWAIDGVHPPAYYLPNASRVTIYGFLGVEVFFMISGFVICMTCWGRGLGEFFASRVGRLYPAYWVGILATLVVTTLLPIDGYVPVYSHFGLTDIGANLTMLQAPLGVDPIDNVYWTLWAELRFYLLFALVVGRGITYRRTVLFCAAWMVAACMAPLVNSPFFTLVTIQHSAPYFIAGIAMYLMYRFGPTPLLWGIVGFSWLVCVHLLDGRIQLKPGFPVPLWPAVLVITVAFGALLLVALHSRDRINWRWLTVAGAVTYPFYLLHQRIGYTVIRHAYDASGLHPGILVAATMLLMLVPAWLVYRFVERPFGPRLRDALLRGVAQVRAAGTEQSRPPGETASRVGPRHGADQPKADDRYVQRLRSRRG